MERKWICCTLLVSLIIVAAIVIPVVIMRKNKTDAKNNRMNGTAGLGTVLTDQNQMGAYGDAGFGGTAGGGTAWGGAGASNSGGAPWGGAGASNSGGAAWGGAGASNSGGAAWGGAGASNGAALAPSEMVVQFGGMVQCLVRRGSLAYNGYGCYCGLGGSGKPLDATDRCCHQHDLCYSNLKKQGICKGDKSVYLTWYKSNFNQCDTPNAKIWCANHHQYSFFDSLLAGKQPRCAASLCHCDRTAAHCFARHSASYNLNYASYQSKNAC